MSARERISQAKGYSRALLEMPPLEDEGMKDEAHIESRTPRIMFAKLLMDSREFLAAAKREWDEAARLAEAAMKVDNERPPNVILDSKKTGNDPRMAVESALTVATMNFTTSIELLLKGFIGVKGRFDRKSLRTLRAINHKTELVLKQIPEWVDALEDLYTQSDVATIRVEVYWNHWNPPNDDWVEDTKRLDTETLRDFLQFLYNERMHEDRFSFERIAGHDFRIKIVEYQKLEVLHGTIERLLCDKAKNIGCLDTGIRITFNSVGEEDVGFKRLKFATRRDAFEYDKQTRGR